MFWVILLVFIFYTLGMIVGYFGAKGDNSDRQKNKDVEIVSQFFKTHSLLYYDGQYYLSKATPSGKYTLSNDTIDEICKEIILQMYGKTD